MKREGMAHETSPETVTRLLERWGDGDQEALERLLPVIYGELRAIASGQMRRERSDHTLTTVDLLHETYLRLIGLDGVRWQNRAQFFGVAARTMRRILVEHARGHLCAKRGGDARRLSLDQALTLSAEQAPELVALDDAMNDLAVVDSDAARIVELRFFAGLTREEIGRLLEISEATVGRKWRSAKAWLYRNLAAEVAGDR